LSSTAAGTLYVVATPIGNLEDVTLRALRVLREADLIAAEDTRAAQVLLERHGISGKRVVSCFEGNEAARAEELVERVLGGETVALVSEAGTPGVSDPGERVVAKAIAAGARVEVLPGASAAVMALVASGLPTEPFYFGGFPPRAEGARREAFGRLRALPATLIFYEAPGRAAATLADLAAALGGGRRAALARELTKMYEEVVRGTLDELAARYAETAPRGEVTLVVEGARAGEAEAALDVEAEIKRRLAAGEGPKEIAAALALATGKPRRQLYQLVLALRPRDPGGT
jgi:16S rRNA (cytidine1402-2'-O)-methyltransferase